MAGNGSAVKVHIDHVVKKFQTRKGEMVALNGVDLDIHENEFITVVGPSGCGKSTLLNIIGGLETPTEGQVTVDGKPVKLTLREFDLLEYLMRKPGVVFSREALLQSVWGWDFDGGSRTVDVHVQTLRQKLGDRSSCIETVRGVGYRFTDHVA